MICGLLLTPLLPPFVHCVGIRLLSSTAHIADPPVQLDFAQNPMNQAIATS